MSFKFDSSLITGSFQYGIGGLGIPGNEIPSEGTAGPSYLYNDIVLPADANKEIRGEVITLPVGGSFFAYEDGSFSFVAPDGAYAFLYRLYVDGVDVGTAAVTLSIGTAALSGGTNLSELLSTGALASGPTLLSGALDVSSFAIGGAINGDVSILSSNAQVSGFVVTGDVSSSPSELSGSISVSDYIAAGGMDVTLALNAQELRQMFVWVGELAKIHGLILNTPLEVTTTRRTAGNIVQLISGTTDNVTVTRQ